MGSSVRAAEWAIEAEPTPASLLKAARRKPWISVPTKPPMPAFQLKASWTMVAMACGHRAGVDGEDQEARRPRRRCT